MKSYFADTSLFVAFLNPRDEYHEPAVEYIRDESNSLTTTSWVLVELGNFVAKSRTRRRFVPFVRDLGEDPLVEVVPPTADLLELALDLYHRRPDKHWSMTDCISFLVMRERGLSEALTTDHHFVQAGFKILLK
jgi:predicted nucleic acid-binding protein